MPSAARTLAITLAAFTIWGCKTPVGPEIDMSGVFTLDAVDGPPVVQGAGTLVLSRGGYAERRIRYNNPDGSFSSEYLSLGEAELLPDSTIRVEFRDLAPRTEIRWHPEVRLTRTGVTLVRYGAYDGTRIVETYRRTTGTQGGIRD